MREKQKLEKKQNWLSNTKQKSSAVWEFEQE